MFRMFYLATLVVLQVAFAVVLAPELAQSLRVGFAALDDPLEIARVATGAVAIGAAALALAFPALAVRRHRRRGRAHFAGLPRWAIATALAGGSACVVAAALASAAAWPVAPDAPMLAELTASARNAGIALMAAGTLCAEVLGRTAGAPVAVAAPQPAAPSRIEVVAPADLATRAG